MRTGQKIIKPPCALCFTEIKFAEGDVIFCDKWFHKECAPKYRLGVLLNK